MKLIFARHGESRANILHKISNRGLKHPLTPNGREQAAALAQALAFRPIDHIYTSPILRAIETAVIVAHRLGVEYEVNDALREYDMGYLEGRSDEGAWNMWRDLFDAWLTGRVEQRIKGGEDFYEVRDRFVPFINDLMRQFQHTGASVLCIGHGGLFWMMLPEVLINIDIAFIEEQGGFPYTGTIIAENTPQGLFCLEWNGAAIAG
jgi:broad specificity phosphatase PhoE